MSGNATKEAETETQITYKELVEASSTGAFAALLDNRFPGRLMQFVKFGRAVHTELEAFEEAKKKLIEMHNGTLQEESNTYDFGANQEMADRDFQELLKTPVTIKCPRLSSEEMEKTSLVPAQVIKLMWMIE